MASKVKIRRGFLSDLSPDLQSKIMKINKIIADTTRDYLKKENKFRDLEDSPWAMSCVDEFCAAPSGKSDIGSVRVYKSRDTYRCEIQVTGRFKNYDYGYIEELLDGLMKNVIIAARPKVRREFDMTLRNNGDKTSPDEGFDVVLSNKESKEIWDSFEDKKTKSITEYTDGTFEIEISDDLADYYEFYSNSGMSYDQYFYEKSHGKLKFDFRAVIDLMTGHKCKLVYDLQSQNGKTYVDIYSHQAPDKYLNDEGKLTDSTAKGYIRDIGNTKHRNSGLKLLAIIDLNTKEKLQEIYCTGIHNAHYNYNNNIYMDRIGDERYIKKLCNDPESGVYHIKVGEIDNAYNWKSTFWPSNNIVNRTNDVVNGMQQDMLSREELSDGDKPHLLENRWKRGYKAQHLTIQRNNRGGWAYGSNEPFKSESKKEREMARYINKLIKDKEMIKDKYESHGEHTDDETRSYKSKMDEIDKKIKDAKKELSDFKKEFIRSIKEVNKKNYDKAMAESYVESTDNTPEYNVDMSEKQAKATLRTLSQDIINKTANNKNYKITQYTANIYANIITKNLLPIWAKGFRKFSITLDSYQSFFKFEFKVPKMTQDFVSRFLDGKESINGFIHREPEIKVKMSPRIFHTMKNPDDAFNFFKLAIQYYDAKLDKVSVSLMYEVRKLGYGMKHLIRTTKLSGLVTYPIQLLFVFDDVNMSNKDTFRISREDIDTVNKFVRGIATHYASPEKEKSKIIEDVKKMVETLHEACEFQDNTSDTRYLPEAIEKYYNGEFNNLLEEAKYNFEYENTDLDWERGQENYQLRQFQEKFGVKKLKKIPADLVAYITIETEAIRDANDKMMISSYCLSKIEIVEWYIELLTVGSKKYVVPHTKPYLENVRTQLLACFKKIMDTPVPKSNGNRPIIDIQYPAGYEG